VDYEAELQAWKDQRISDLTSAISWTSLSGLYWLKEGQNTLGSGSDASIKFPDDAPKFIATIINDSTSQRVVAAEGVELKEGGKQVLEANLISDQEENTTRLNVGPYYFTLIDRENRLGIRIWDTLNVNRNKYKALDYYPVNNEMRVKAQFESYDTSEVLTLKNALGMDVRQEIAGELIFELGGQLQRFKPLDGGPDHFFLIFADETSGGETYGGGRYLYCPRPDSSGTTFIDFNKAFTPPCGFTEFATCLLPTEENTFDFAILSGEKYGFDH